MKATKPPQLVIDFDHDGQHVMQNPTKNYMTSFIFARLRITLATLLALVCGHDAIAVVAPSPMFQDHAVLQQGQPVPVWGTADPGEEVTVTYRSISVKTRSDSDGKWRVDLPKLDYGLPSELVIEGSNRIVFHDVVVGEVWLGSGQSNMFNSGYPEEDPRFAQIQAGGPYPDLRLYMVDADERGKGAPVRWKPATGEDSKRFSALLFLFGLRLQQELGVPVGVIIAAKSGTPSGAWLSEAAFKEDPGCQKGLEVAWKKHPESLAKYAQALANWEAKNKNIPPPQSPSPANPSVNSNDPLAKMPTPPVQPGTLKDDNPVGYLYESHIRPTIPYALRGILWDQGEGGTGLGDFHGQLVVMPALFNGWRKERGQPDLPFFVIEKPSGSGCAWDPAHPDTVLAVPFNPVLPSKAPGVRSDGWHIQINYLRLRNEPHVYMVTTSDLSPPAGAGDVNTHPRNKSAYANRTVQAALANIYRKKVPWCGPEFESATVEGSAVRINFKHIGDGLAFKHGEKLQGFSMRDAKFPARDWRWADARIDGNTVVLSSPEVITPAEVAYGYSTSRHWANLFNKEGLPAIPFSIQLDSTNTAGGTSTKGH